MRRQHVHQGIHRSKKTYWLLPELEAAISNTAVRFNVSEGYVAATLFADVYNIKQQERYYDEQKQTRKTTKRISGKGKRHTNRSKVIRFSKLRKAG